MGRWGSRGKAALKRRCDNGLPVPGSAATNGRTSLQRQGPELTATADTLTASGHVAGTTGPSSRRDFLFIATGAIAAVGTAVTLWPFIDQMEPDAATTAAGAPVDVDLSKLEPGQQVVVLWRGAPILIVHRSSEALKTLQDQALVDQLSDPDSGVDQQPRYAQNWHRSVTPDFAVLVGICTHLGCIPQFFPNPSPSDPISNWLGGYFCPCHGSKYDLAGRVYRGVPAPYNLPVPPYHMVNDKMLRVGENPEGENFNLDSIVQV
ncbi:MAG: ubiquinol-cytochrome c reductase iron-sulfur subunit [Methylobacteriaceae bacterium]|nr:ubiquinol-cytochrome c reductase iron-sulfur subunit [Methylobacteriaceae bacterium]